MDNATINPALAASGAAAPGAARKRGEEMSEQFLTLLIAQMKNQSPLNPMDNSKVTSQIAQINTVSGINDLNDTLRTITGQIDTTQRLQASALVGRNVLVPGDDIAVGEEGAATPFGMELAGPAEKVTLTITDAAGTLVHESSYTGQQAGIQSFSWDGRDAEESLVGPGSYRVDIVATAPDGSPVQVQPLTMGYVGGVVAGDGDGPKLDLGPNGLVSLDDVRQII